jgi:ubiquinone/menaquinone biosynthesis C-methylase UbiE
MPTDLSTLSAVRGEVPEAFDDVADRYDLMVALNPGYHSHLRRSASALVASLDGARQPLRLVDVGCGSGASTRALLAELDCLPASARVLGVDGSAGMLQQATAKPWPAEVTFVQGRAEDLEEVCLGAGFGSADGVFAAYLLRNLPDRKSFLDSVFGLLRPGGTLVVHEYSVAGRALSSAMWTAVCQGVIVPLGWLTSRQTRIYRYLWRSVLDMDSVEQVMNQMVSAGFEDVRSRSVPGWQRGIVHTFHGRRPA